MKVLVCDRIAKEGIEILKKEFEVDVRTNLSEKELINIIGQYDAIIIRSATKVTKKVIEKSKLKVIGRAGVGVDNIDLDTATKKGILVINAPNGNTISASEHTIALIMALARKIPQATKSLKEKKWERSKFVGTELNGKILGIIGLGRIGTEVAKRAIGLGMRILAYDPYLSKDHMENPAIKIKDFITVLRNADFITIHTPLTSKTYHMIQAEQISMMKDNVMIVNCARGGIINEKDLYKALISGKVSGCAIDVFEHEPAYENPLLNLPNVIATPHIGASTYEAQSCVAKDVARDVIRALKGELVSNPVNTIAIKPNDMWEIKPFIELAEKIGSFYSQLKGGRIKEIEMKYEGWIQQKDVDLVTMAGIKGLLVNILHQPVNFVNSFMLAKQRGIKVTQKKVKGNDNMPGIVTMEVISDEGSGSISGTVYERNYKKIISIDSYDLDLVPSGNILITYHKDVPGIVGKVGCILGKNNINIAYMQLDRRSYKGEALMAIGTDHILPEDILTEIRSIENIRKANIIKL